MSLAPFLVLSKSGSSKSKHSNVAILFYTAIGVHVLLMDLRGKGRRKGGKEKIEENFFNVQIEKNMQMTLPIERASRYLKI